MEYGSRNKEARGRRRCVWTRLVAVGNFLSMWDGGWRTCVERTERRFQRKEVSKGGGEKRPGKEEEEQRTEERSTKEKES